MKNVLSRRDFVRSSALAAAAIAVPAETFAAMRKSASPAAAGAIRLGLSSYTFRNFERAKLINFIKLLNLSSVNIKDVKDHLPSDAKLEADAVADYAAAGIKLHAAGTIYFAKNHDPAIRAKFHSSTPPTIQSIL